MAEQLSRLQAAGIHAFGVSGNHDTPRQKTEQGGFAPQSLYGKLKGMHFFSSSDQIQPVLLEIAGIQVALAGLSYHPHVPPGGDPFDQVQIVDPEGVLEQAQVGILILHTAIEGHAFPGQMEIFARRDSLAHLAGFQIVLAGHVHAYDRFSIGDKTVVVCGATERMEFGQDEEQVGFVFLEITSERLLHSERVPIEPQPRHLLRLRTAELWSHHEAMQEEQTDDLPADEEKRFFSDRISRHLCDRTDLATGRAFVYGGCNSACDARRATDTRAIPRTGSTRPLATGTTTGLFVRG